jgi:hypothetical protein
MIGFRTLNPLCTALLTRKERKAVTWCCLKNRRTSLKASTIRRRFSDTVITADEMMATAEHCTKSPAICTEIATDISALFWGISSELPDNKHVKVQCSAAK